MKTYPHDVVDSCSKRGWVVVAVCDLPFDPHLQIVLCHLPENELTTWVVWYFNKETGGCSSGEYLRNLLAAAFAYTRRSMRYGGVPGKDLPSMEQIKEADQMLWG